MPAVIHKIDFSAPADRADGSGHSHTVHRKVIPFATETGLPTVCRPLRPLPYYQRHEAITAGLVALGLHLAGFALIPDAVQEEPVTASAPIQVAWIASPRPKAENPPAPRPKQQKPVIKSKPKTVKRIKNQQKTLLATRAPSAAMSTASKGSAAQTPVPSVTRAFETPIAKPSATAVQSSSVPETLATDSQPPLTLPSLNADYLHNPAPPYPEDARERGEQGKVLVRALINIDGTVAQLAMRKSSGYASLDQSALETVKKWRFVPARRGAAAVTAWVVVPISFSLEG